MYVYKKKNDLQTLTFSFTYMTCYKCFTKLTILLTFKDKTESILGAESTNISIERAFTSKAIQ